MLTLTKTLILTITQIITLTHQNVVTNSPKIIPNCLRTPKKGRHRALVRARIPRSSTEIHTIIMMYKNCIISYVIPELGLCLGGKGQLICCVTRGREGGREGGRKGGREEGRKEGGREGREGGREGCGEGEGGREERGGRVGGRGEG